ncbi:MAG: hypothetical protein WC829_03210 [Hyphomicrobium sp.]|jgi:hypothetical protein
MSEINNGGAAFPSSNSPDTGWYAEGMTLRDYFASKVLPAIYDDSLGGQDWRDAVANEAYQLADAMLKAREAT